MGRCVRAGTTHDVICLDKDDILPENCNFDIVLDFSLASALEENLQIAQKYKTPIVIATTGHSSSSKKKIKQAANTIPVFYSANMSLGVNLITQLLKKCSVLKNCNCTITETHHKNKKDTPSGTAKCLQNALEKMGINANILAIRGGTVVGEHSVIFLGEGERVTISHTAEDRTIFAKGAIAACEYLINKNAGFYTMEDLLKGYDSM